MDKNYVLVQVHRIFDGTNAADMVAGMVASNYPDANITASANYPGASATLQVRTDLEENGGYLVNFAVGDSWYVTQSGQAGMFPAASLANAGYMVDFDSFVTDVCGPIATAAASAALSAVPVPMVAVGYATTPSLLVGASAAVNVDMSPALPDSGYNVAVALAGSAQLLGALAILGHTVVDADTVEVRIQNNGLLTLAGATILVTALHNG